MPLQPYLFFEGRCAEALDFYAQALGAEIVMKMRFDESPKPASEECQMDVPLDKIMHAAFRIGDDLVMASDGMCSGSPEFRGVSLALSVSDAATVDRMFAALSEGGKVQMPLAETFWSPRFGVVEDRFGVSWMVGVEVEEGADEATASGSAPA